MVKDLGFRISGLRNLPAPANAIPLGLGKVVG